MSLATPNIAGYSFDQAPDLTDVAERERLSSSAMKPFVRIAGKWRLSEAQARGLLGGVASSTFHAWKTRPRGREFIRFLNHLETQVPADQEIHLIMDNYCTHKSEEVQRWLKPKKRKRFHFHFTPPAVPG